MGSDRNSAARRDGEKVDELIQVTPVGGDGILARLPLASAIVEKVLDLTVHYCPSLLVMGI